MTDDKGTPERPGGREGSRSTEFTGDAAESARLAEARQQREAVEPALEGRLAREARTHLARQMISRRAEEMRGMGEIEAAQRIVLEEVPEEERTPDAEKRGARQVAAAFLLSAAATIAFLTLYVLSDPHHHLRRQNTLFGLCLGVAMLGIGIGAILWVKKVMPHQDTVQLRHDLHPTPEERRSLELDFARGVDESGVTRRKVLLGTLGVSAGLLPLAPLFLLRDLGPSPTGASGKSLLTYTSWRPNMRFTDYDTNQPVKMGDIAVGSLLTVVPEGHADAAADSSVMLIRLAPETIDESAFDGYAAKWHDKHPQLKGSNFVVDGHVAYSKICTHAGCPVSLYERQLHQFLCPCHQSTFEAAKAGKVIFGPAARALPMLPFYVDNDGYFRALGDFPEPVGPSFWERG